MCVGLVADEERKQGAKPHGAALCARPHQGEQGRPVGAEFTKHHA